MSPHTGNTKHIPKLQIYSSL